jgi:hypothetical protein
MGRLLGQQGQQYKLQFGGAELAAAWKTVAAHKAAAEAALEYQAQTVPATAPADGMEEVTWA